MTESTAARVAALTLGAALLAACASSTVVLLPEKDGRAASVAVERDGNKVVLEEPYAAARTGPFGPRSYRSSPDEVRQQFGTALAAQPARAVAFTLYFVEGTDELTDPSKREVDDILAEIARRPVPDVLVVGHTDAVGNDQANDALGQQRADSVRAALLARGIAPHNIQAISRGKRELAVPTPDGVAEPRNRRVEILVR